MDSIPDVAADPEAPWPRAPTPRACRPLPWALGVALLLLAATCAACVARTWALPASAGPGPEDFGVQFNASAHPLHKPRQGQGTYAKLLAQNVSLVNGTLSWFSTPGMKGVHLSPDLSYDKDKWELVVAEAGAYYVFLQLNLGRRVKTSQVSGRVSVALQSQPPGAGATDLTVTVDLLSCLSQDSAGGFRGRLLHLDAGQRLSVRLTVHLQGEGNAHKDWQLTQSSNVLGLLRVTEEVPAGFFST